MPGDHPIENLLRDVIGGPILPDTEMLLCPFIKPGKVPALDLPDDNNHMIVLKKTVPIIQHLFFGPDTLLPVDIGTQDEIMPHLNDASDKTVDFLVLHAGKHDNLD